MEKQNNVSIPIEEKLRRPGFFADPKMRLHDGKEWYIAPMPLGKKGRQIQEHLKKYLAAVESGETTQIFDCVEDMGIIVHRILQINYPKLQYEQVEYLVTMAEFNDFLLYVMHGPRAIDFIEDSAKNAESPAETGPQKKK